MRLSEYSAVARTTTIYPESREYEYPVLGIGGEIGELVGKLDDVLPDMANGVKVDLAPVRKEIGDILWYISAVSEDAGIGMADIFTGFSLGEDVTFQRIQQKAPKISPMKFASLAGEACELAKKYIRDDDFIMTSERRGKVKLNLMAILIGLGAMCNLVGVSLEEAAQENLDKLLSRQKRGVLQGSGDNR